MVPSAEPSCLPTGAAWSEVRVTVPATTANLGPGFDALGMALNLYNHIQAQPRGLPGLSVVVHGEGKGTLPADPTNLVARTFSAYFNERHLAVPGATLTCTNNIPLARGLGSSAAAIVGALKTAAEVEAQLYGTYMSDDELLALGTSLEGHPDNVAAALFGGLVVVVEATDASAPRYHHARMEPPTDMGVVVAIPSYTLSSAESRRVLPKLIDRKDAVFNLGRVGLLVAAMTAGRLELLGPAMEDRLHQQYREKGVPGLSRAIAVARRAGAAGVALSGSGPSVVALVGKREALMAKVGDALGKALAIAGVTVEVLQLHPEPRGCRVDNTRNAL